MLDFRILLIFFVLSLTACCTLTINNVQSRGVAEDVVDSDPINDVKPTTDLTIPLKGV